MAHKATEHILILFVSAVMRYRQRVPDRREKCGSYQFD